MEINNVNPEEMNFTYNETEFQQDNLEFDTEEMERIDEINEILQAESIEPNVAMNILINAVQVSYDKDHFNELDRYLIAKALTCFQQYVERNEDILIKVGE